MALPSNEPIAEPTILSFISKLSTKLSIYGLRA
jgi:hypothetical protein